MNYFELLVSTTISFEVASTGFINYLHSLRLQMIYIPFMDNLCKIIDIDFAMLRKLLTLKYKNDELFNSPAMRKNNTIDFPVKFIFKVFLNFLLCYITKQIWLKKDSTIEIKAQFLIINKINVIRLSHKFSINSFTTHYELDMSIQSKRIVWLYFSLQIV